MNKKRLTSFAGRTTALAGTIGLLMLSGQAFAVDAEAEFRAGYGTSDNIGRLPENEIEEDILTGGLDLNILEQTRRIDFTLRSSFDYVSYQDETFENDWIGGAVVNATYWFVPERFSWMIQNNWGQQVFDPLSTTDPSNRENINYLTTGPTVRIPVGTRNTVGLDLRVSSVNYELQDLNNQRQMGRLFYDRAIRDDANMSINLRSRSVEFDSGVTADDYDVTELFIRYEKESARDYVYADVGWAEVDVENDDETRDGYLLELNWTRTVSTSTSVTYFAGSRFTDGVDLFRDIQDSTQDIGDTVDINGFDEPFLNHYLGFRYDFRGSRTGAVVALDWSQDDFEVEPGQTGFDRDISRVDLRLSRQLTRDFFIEMQARYLRRDYKYIDRLDKDTLGSLTFGYNFTPSLSMSLEGQYLDRDAVEFEDTFTEVRYFLRLAYVPDWGRPIAQ